MKKNTLVIVGAVALMSLASAFSSFAGEWKQDTTGWFYQNTDGSYLSSGWYWVNGKSYYFNEQGYCLTSTTTPDGYTVDDSGAWTEGGIVKTRATEETLSSIRVVIPNGYIYDYTKDNLLESLDSIEMHESSNTFDDSILVMTAKSEDIAYIKDLYGMAGLKSISDELAQVIVSELSDTMTQDSVSNKSYSSTGTWYYYHYKEPNRDNSLKSVEFYISFTDTEIRTIVIYNGAGREFTSSDQFMENCIR